MLFQLARLAFISAVLFALLALVSGVEEADQAVLESKKAMSPSALFVSNSIKKYPIVIFAKSYCPFCVRAKALFKELNQPATSFDLDLMGSFASTLFERSL